MVGKSSNRFIRSYVQGVIDGRKAKKLNIASSTASESVTSGRQIVEEQELKLLDEDIE